MADVVEEETPRPVTYSSRLHDGIGKLSPEREYRKVIGKRIRVRRIWMEISQKDLAEMSGVRRGALTDIETGVCSLDATRMRYISVVLEMSLADLLAEPGEGEGP